MRDRNFVFAMFVLRMTRSAEQFVVNVIPSRTIDSSCDAARKTLQEPFVRGGLKVALLFGSRTSRFAPPRVSLRRVLPLGIASDPLR